MKSAQASESAPGDTHGPDGAAALTAAEGRARAEVGAEKIVGVGAVVGIAGRDLFAALGIIVPVIQAVLLVGVDVALLFLAASGDSECAYQDQRNLECASPAHNMYLPCWLNEVTPGEDSDG
jgi:hypothetical protein